MSKIKTLITGAVALTLLGAGGASAQDLSKVKEPTGLNPLEVVYTFKQQMPVGIAITSTGRQFVSYPRWEDKIDFTLAELKDGKEVPVPAGRRVPERAERRPAIPISLSARNPRGCGG